MAGRVFKEITVEKKGNRISEHNNTTTPEKITCMCVCVCVFVCVPMLYILKEKNNRNTYNYKLSFCLFTPVLK